MSVPQADAQVNRVLVANKCDSEASRQVSVDEGRRLADLSGDWFNAFALGGHSDKVGQCTAIHRTTTTPTSCNVGGHSILSLFFGFGFATEFCTHFSFFCKCLLFGSHI